MPRPNFSWHPDTGSQCSTEPIVEPVKFGDGYELRSTSVINSVPEVWSLKFTRLMTEALAIDGFLKARKGAEAFTWTTPENVEGTFVCRKWNKTRMKGEAMEITCEFEQVFEH